RDGPRFGRDIGFDLLIRVLEFIEGCLHRMWNDAILQADRHGHESVIPRLDTELERDLPGLQRERPPGGLQGPGGLDRQARLTIAAITTKGFEHSDMLLRGDNEDRPEP